MGLIIPLSERKMELKDYMLLDPTILMESNLEEYDVKRCLEQHKKP